LIAARRGAALRNDSLSVKVFLQKSHTAQLAITSENVLHGFSLGFVDHDAALAYVVAERNKAAHPDSSSLRRSDLVADSLAGYLPFELGERQQYVQRQSPHRSCGIELLRDGNK
jgi:hypothetical protein